MKLIKLSRGFFASVDNEDYEFLNQWKWHVCKKKKVGVMYAHRNIPDGNGGQTTIRMHRVILGLSDSKIIVDHKDGNGLNNTRNNLRIASYSENIANRKPFGKYSKYRGVSLIVTKYGQYWYAKCSKGNNLKTKICKTEKEAAMYYNEFAKQVHGEFARLNTIN